MRNLIAVTILALALVACRNSDSRVNDILAGERIVATLEAPDRSDAGYSIVSSAETPTPDETWESSVAAAITTSKSEQLAAIGAMLLIESGAAFFVLFAVLVTRSVKRSR